MDGISSTAVSALATLRLISPQAAEDTAPKLVKIAAGLNPTSARALSLGASDAIFRIAAQQDRADGLFQMNNAKREYAASGEYTETATGQGTVASDEDVMAEGLRMVRKQAVGDGPDAVRARAYIKAHEDGTYQEIDLSAKGVSATMTATNYYYADGGIKGQGVSYKVTGLNEFLESHTYQGDDGKMRDNETGKYASIKQNGTNFFYTLF